MGVPVPLCPAVLHHIPGAAEGRGEGRECCQWWAASLNPKRCCWEQPASQVLPCQLHPVRPITHLPDCPLAQKGAVTGPCSPKHHHLSPVPEHQAGLPQHLLVFPCTGTHLSCAWRMLCWGSCQGHPQGLSLGLLPCIVTTAPVAPNIVSPILPTNLDPAEHHLGVVMPLEVAVILPMSLHVSSLLCRHLAQSGLLRLCPLSPTTISLILQGLCSLLTSSLGAFPDKWGSPLLDRGSPGELQ